MKSIKTELLYPNQIGVSNKNPSPAPMSYGVDMTLGEVGESGHHKFSCMYSSNNLLSFKWWLIACNNPH